LGRSFLKRSKKIVDKINNPKTTAFYLLQENWATEYAGDMGSAAKKIDIAYPLVRSYLEAYHTSPIAMCKLLNLQYRALYRETIAAAPEVIRDIERAKQRAHISVARGSVYSSLVSI